MVNTNKPKYIIIHCSDVSWTALRDQFNSINAYHRDDRGFPRSSLGYFVGYQRLVTGGRNYQARIDTEEGAHCNQVLEGVSMNFQSLGICFGGDGDIEYPHPDDYVLLKEQVQLWQRMYAIPNQNVFYHRHFAKEKTCAGSMLGDEWMARLLSTDVPAPKTPEQQENQIAILLKKISLLQRVVELMQLLKLMQK